MTEEEKAKRLAALDALSALDQELGFDDQSLPTSCEIDGFKLVCTCPACPEQYEVFTQAGEQIGYLRLRHGWFRADYPRCGGETVYESNPKGDGIFDDDERLSELTKAVRALAHRHAAKA